MRWECIKCDYKNTTGRTICKKCKTPKRKDTDSKTEPNQHSNHQFQQNYAGPIVTTVLAPPSTAPSHPPPLYPMLFSAPHPVSTPAITGPPTYQSIYPTLPMLPPVQSPPTSPPTSPTNLPQYTPTSVHHTVMIQCTHCKATQGVVQPIYCHQCGTKFSSAVGYSSVFMM